jgi:tetratricopeptide (TPR) repeat protein
MTLSNPIAKIISGGVLVLAVCFAQAGCHRSAKYYFDTANKYYSQGKFADASLNYRKSIQQNPNFAEAHYRLGLTELKAGHQNSAYEELQRSAGLEPKRDDIKVQLADIALNGYQASPDKPKVLYDQVVNTADDLLGRDPNSFDGLRLRADVLSINKRFDEAISTFKKADKIRPSDPGVVFPMIQVMLRLNQGPEAENLAKSFLQGHKDVGSVYDVLIAEYIRDKRMADAEALLKSKVANMPSDAGPVVQLASFYWQLKRESEAQQELQRILKDPRDFPRGHAIVGDFYAGNQKWEDAIREYNTGLQSNPKDKTFYRKEIVKALVAQGKREDAINELNQILKDIPDDTDSRTERAILLRQSNDPKKLGLALSEFNALKETNPKDEVVQYNLGLVYFARGDLAAAREHLTESSKIQPRYIDPRLVLVEMDLKERKYSEAIHTAEEVLAVDPRNLDARLWHAAGLLGNRAFDQARNEMNALLRENPDSLNVNLNAAVLDAAEKKYSAAEARYLRFYKPGQQNLMPLEGLVQLYTVERETDKALKLIDNELKLAPDSAFVHLLLASTAIRAGKLDLAAQQYEWLRSKDPNSVQVYASLGDLYQLKGDINGALESYQKARDLAPNNPGIIAMIAFLQNTSGKEIEAIGTLQKQLAMDPENTIAMNNLAFALADTSTDLDKALTLAQSAQRKAPSNPGIADTVGWVYVKKGLNDSAIQIFNGLVKKYPDEPAFRYHLGVALLQKGEPAEAKAEFEISLSKNPPKDIAEKIKQILSKLG